MLCLKLHWQWPWGNQLKQQWFLPVVPLKLFYWLLLKWFKVLNHFKPNRSKCVMMMMMMTFRLLTRFFSLGLSQKPKMKMSQLVEGEETTLTCTAPGLCSGSDPKFSWSWSRAGEDFNVPDPSITNLGRTSTLSFIPSAEQHGAEVTCKVTFPGEVTTEEKACVNMRRKYHSFAVDNIFCPKIHKSYG